MSDDHDDQSALHHTVAGTAVLTGALFRLMVAIVGSAIGVFALGLRGWIVYLLIGFVLVSALSVWLLRIGKSGKARIYLSLLFDSTMLTTLLYLTGVQVTPVVVFIFPLMVIHTVAHGILPGLVVGTLTSIGLGGVLLLEELSLISRGSMLVGELDSLTAPGGSLAVFLFTGISLWSTLAFLVFALRRLEEHRRTELKLVQSERAAESRSSKLEFQLLEAQRLKNLGRLTGGIAHDMNNVLNVIKGFASMLELDAKDESTKEDARCILDSATQGEELTKNLLGFARQGKNLKERLSLNSVVTDVVSLAQRAMSSSLEIRADLQEDLADVDGDQSQLHHALMNLVVNSADAIGEVGSITVRTTLEVLTEVSPEGLQPGQYVKAEVIDTGIGMDSETAKSVFEPFYTTKPSGTGLGLSMVRGSINNHGGSVSLESEKKCGTTVTILLPAIMASVETELVEDETPNIPLNSTGAGLILLIDDEHIVGRTMQRILQRAGYEVILADGGRSGVELYRERGSEISLVILDMVMPVMDGPETFAKLRESGRDVQILLYSGYSVEGAAKSLLAAGAVGFMTKPVDRIKLLDTVSQFVTSA